MFEADADAETEAKASRPSPKPNLRGRGRGQIFEAEAKILASRPLWPRGLNITEKHTCNRGG